MMCCIVDVSRYRENLSLEVPMSAEPTDGTVGDPDPPPILAPRRSSTRDRHPPDRYEPEP